MSMVITILVHQETCSACKGSGFIRGEWWFNQHLTSVCGVCKGEGFVVAPDPRQAIESNKPVTVRPREV